METGEKVSLLVSMTAAVLAVAIGLSAFAYLYRAGELRLLHLENQRAISIRPLPSSAQLSELWFSQGKTLLATFENEATASVLVRSWDLDKNKQVLNGSFRLPIGQDRPKLLNSFHSGMPEAADPAEGALSYAISNDASRIVWVWKGQLFQGRLLFKQLGGPIKVDSIASVESVAPTPPALASAVALIGQETVIFFDAANNLGVWSARGKDVYLRSSFDSQDIRLFWGRSDNFRVLHSVKSGTSVNLDTRDLLKSRRPGFKILPPFPASTCFAVSGSGGILVGTENGTVFAPDSPASHFVPLENMGRVNSVAFYNNTWAIVGGESSRLFLIKDGSLAHIFSPAPPRVRFLAVNEERIAYAISDRLLIVGHLTWKYGLSDRAKWWLALIFSLVGLLGFLRVIAIDAIKLLYAHQQTEPSVDSGEGSQEGPPPPAPSTIKSREADQ